MLRIRRGPSQFGGRWASQGRSSEPTQCSVGPYYHDLVLSTEGKHLKILRPTSELSQYMHVWPDIRLFLSFLPGLIPKYGPGSQTRSFRSFSQNVTVGWTWHKGPSTCTLVWSICQRSRITLLITRNRWLGPWPRHMCTSMFNLFPSL